MEGRCTHRRTPGSLPLRRHRSGPAPGNIREAVPRRVDASRRRIRRSPVGAASPRLRPTASGPAGGSGARCAWDAGSFRSSTDRGCARTRRPSLASGVRGRRGASRLSSHREGDHTPAWGPSAQRLRGRSRGLRHLPNAANRAERLTSEMSDGATPAPLVASLLVGPIVTPRPPVTMKVVAQHALEAPPSETRGASRRPSRPRERWTGRLGEEHSGRSSPSAGLHDDAPGATAGQLTQIS